MQGAPAAGGLYFYTYGFNDLTGQVKVIALASGMAFFDIATTMPQDQQENIACDSELWILFTQQPKLESITESSLQLYRKGDESPVKYKIRNTASRKVTIAPEDFLEGTTEYVLKVTSDITALDGTALHDTHTFEFNHRRE
jgi:hypothetical protein